MSVDPNSFDAASTSQVRLKDAYLGGLVEKQRGKPSHQEEEDSEDSDNPEAEIWYCTGKQVTWEPVAPNTEAWEQPLAHGASSSVDKESQKRYRSDMETLPPSIATHIRCFWKPSFSMVREIYERKLGDPMKDLDVNLAIW